MINGFNINYHGKIMVIINYKNNSRSDNKISLPGYQMATLTTLLILQLWSNNSTKA